MKIFEFHFHNNYENEDYYVPVLAYSVEEAIELIRKHPYIGNYFTNFDIEFKGCIAVYEMDKSKVIY